MKMHRTVEAKAEGLSKSSYELRDLFEAAFADAIGLRYSELQKKLMANRGYAMKTCEGKISIAKKKGFIRLEHGYYYFNEIKESE
mgnify:CR=1 FL=1